MNWLNYPSWYRLLQRTIGNPKSRETFVNSYLRPVAGERLLDLGCGTGTIVDFLPPLEYYGLDNNAYYIDFAKKKFGKQAKFFNADLCALPWPVSGSFDRAMAIGVLHHLSDEQALQVLKNAKKMMKPGAKLVTLDGCYETNQSPIAHFLLSMDRGKYVRNKDGYAALVRPFFKQVSFHFERKLLRVPYLHLIMEMTVTD